jgi:hypothetical protein
MINDVLLSATFADNQAIGGSGSTGVSGGAIANSGTIVMVGSILANNLVGNCKNISPGVFASLGGSISNDGTCGLGTHTAANGLTIGDNVDPLLDPAGLTDNGGPTQTIALLPPSPAIDAIPFTLCPHIDQRGFHRPDNGESACDSGAFESLDFAGMPGANNCLGDSDSALARKYGCLRNAASALGFSRVKVMQYVIRAWCGG